VCEADDAGPEGVDDARGLVAGDTWQLVRTEAPLLEKEVGSAYAAGLHPDPHLTRPRDRYRSIDQPERLADTRELERAH
jgi:hypothetical protein